MHVNLLENLWTNSDLAAHGHSPLVNGACACPSTGIDFKDISEGSRNSVRHKVGGCINGLFILPCVHWARRPGSASLTARRTLLVTGLPRIDWGSRSLGGPWACLLGPRTPWTEGSSARSIFPATLVLLRAWFLPNTSMGGTKELRHLKGELVIFSICDFS